MDMAQLTTERWMLADIGLAALLSALLGLEREREAKPTGLRTNIIVGSVSCLFVLLSPERIAFIQRQGFGESRYGPAPYPAAAAGGDQLFGGRDHSEKQRPGSHSLPHYRRHAVFIR